MMIFPNPCIQEVFRDFCDVSGFLPKVKVGDAVRCLGENPLQSEVTHTLTLHFGHALICYVMFRLPT